jgi:hypothetical protein
MIGHAFVKRGILVSFLVLAPAVSATAEVIAIKSGTLSFGTGSGSLRLVISGNRDFRFEGFTLTGINEPYESCGFGACEPGQTATLHATWTGNDLPGVAELRGKTYPDVGGHNSPNWLRVTFSGEVPIPLVGDQPVTITVPFDFAGIFVYAPNLESPMQEALLTGGGVATFVLVPGADGTSWSARSAEFEFRPVRR